MVPAVELSQVTHVYVTEREAKLAIDGLSVTIMPGQFVSLVGPSGCGKTTLLSIIAGLLQPTYGSVSVYGQRVNGPSPRVGYMLQQDYLFPWRTILENACIGLELTRQLNPVSKERVIRLLDGMGLGGTESLYPHQLSGGMRQRVALVRTLATEPELLLLDEPFSALDYQTKLQLEDLIVETLKAHRKTAVLVTHDLSEAIAVSDRVIVLNRDPGNIRRAFDVPESIRETQPFYAREQAGFNDLFHDLWKELEASDRRGSDGKANGG
ncbi:ABC transporter ATP-binding protein [Paenibacillus apiarius]|uniref:ABC transporter ATP-binding protein n=1 Tax=Paenibacillus apiarius TaxID=46240 RepID=A0ABT4DVJ7_9BACL|nr:ABC transporter ATP-binding protein [Paenibacillus apiarius]MBN3527519.1 ABC transporter ATP-binding protein [Paenibacillus apiarius]MCY9515875.1 ABC transporter ATP-binding protein [Paenibacillus apiarius]MCY9520785.1 ABC transporter ATP-binding protein [Paenibacillus apiarius]MCY9553489.1 ABC transporter ATP-binding protein [Paenibacillus apiarius]MCY9557987.1 ABC transporter ATP-binding protein [Paenibacillus apiarius]